MAGDGDQTMNYESYILPHLLPEVRPREGHDDPLRDDPDEQFFIRTHQAFEIWFAQILAELEYARLLLAQPPPRYVPESDIPNAEQHVRRATAIFDLVRHHLPLLETLKTSSFYNFRRHLFGASGTQSHRFRELEWLMGLLDEDLIEYTKRKVGLERKLLANESGAIPSEQEYESLARYQAQWNEMRAPGKAKLDPRHFGAMPVTHEALQRRLRDIAGNGTLRSQAMKWLARTTFPARRGGRPHAKHGALFGERFQRAYRTAHASDSRVLRELQGMKSGDIKRVNRHANRRVTFFFEEPHRRAIVFLLQFSDQPLLAWPASLIEALLELDQAFANWRDRHLAMVARVLGGGRISTLGAAGSGLPYLRGTATKRACPEIWDARSFTLSRAEAKDIYTEKQLAPYGFLHENRPRSRS